MGASFPLNPALLIPGCLKTRVCLPHGRPDVSKILVFTCGFSVACGTRPKPKRTTRALALPTERLILSRIDGESKEEANLIHVPLFATEMDQDRESSPFVGQALLNDLRTSKPKITTSKSSWNVQLPDRSRGIHSQQIQTTEKQQPEQSGESNKRKPQSEDGSMNHVDISKRARNKKSKTQRTPKEHDRGVWQVPDVAFNQDASGVTGTASNKSMKESNDNNRNGQASTAQVPRKPTSRLITDAASNGLWVDLKAKALANVRNSSNSGEKNLTDKNNSQVITMQAQKAQAGWSNKARKRLNKINRKMGLVDEGKQSASKPCPTDEAKDTIGSRVSERRAAGRQNRRRGVQVGSSTHDGDHGDPGSVQDIPNSHRGRPLEYEYRTQLGYGEPPRQFAASERRYDDYYRPSRPQDFEYRTQKGYFEPPPRTRHTAHSERYYDGYHPDPGQQLESYHMRNHTQMDYANSQPYAAPHAWRYGSYYRPGQPQYPEYIAQRGFVEPAASVRESYQYHSLGRGIWPGQQTQHSTASFSGPTLHDVNNAFRSMNLGQSQGRLANTDSGNQHSNIGFAPQTSSTAYNFGNDGRNNASFPVATSFTQASAMHTSAQQNNPLVSRVPSAAPRSRSPLKPAGIGFDTVVPSIAPKPSELYLNQAANPPSRMSTPQPLLIISDLNGTLISRKKGTSFKPRPGLSSFLAFVMDAAEDQSHGKPEQHQSKFPTSAPKKGSLNSQYSARATETTGPTATTKNKNFRFMIWTSARPRTISRIVDDLLTPTQRSGVVAIWARDALSLTAAQYHGKTQVYKRLETVWRDTAIQRTHPGYAQGERWSQRNSVLIDDSIQKGCSEPFNLINVPELTVGRLGREQGLAKGKIPSWRLASAAPAEADASNASSADVLGEGPPGILRLVAEYIEKARWYADVSSFMRSQPFGVDMAAGGAPSAAGKGDDNEESEDADDDMGVDEGVPIGQDQD